MRISAPRRLSLSSWAVHGWLEATYWDKPGEPHDGQGDLGRLAALPGEMGRHGIQTLELCHFHLPRSRDQEFTELCRLAEVQPYQLLIDGGDISHPEHGERDRDWILSWIDTAADIGFARVRVIAGQTTGDGAYERAVSAMRTLCDRAGALGLRLVFENWFPLMATPDAVRGMHAAMAGDAGLCFDFGNWSGDDKYKKLGQIVDLAESCHAKCAYAEGKPDAVDFAKCLDLTREVGFVGPYTIVHGEAGREWETIDEQVALVRPYL